ncbi:unnamed protein product [Danaus chrysippus]|uniref:(African queen) hypothetical protein n=1 Tax=Danaus chrysippus TaxID=151541 RepID=A0A8J2QRR4_9NEOP|nr:unnamed protein product [Danaus chrysippus]
MFLEDFSLYLTPQADESEATNDSSCCAGTYIFNDLNIYIARRLRENVFHIRYGIGSLGASRNAYATEDDRISAAQRTGLARETGAAATKLNIQKRPSAARLPNTA